MKQAYTKQLYERIYKQMRMKPDPQVFLGMAARAQTVDTMLFFFIVRAAWIRGYLQLKLLHVSFLQSCQLVHVAKCQGPC